MYRVWYSTESFANFIIDNTNLSKEKSLQKSKLFESDANNAKNFHTMPDHIRKILYLDACDLIVEKENEPIFSIEISTEAGTGHNAFQRFARISASIENNVPAFYIYPEGVLVTRAASGTKWDMINPLIFKAMNDMMYIYNIPALLYYFPTTIKSTSSPTTGSLLSKGLRFEKDINYPGCPDSSDSKIKSMFDAINIILDKTNLLGVIPARQTLISNKIISAQRDFMNSEFALKSNGRQISKMSPLSSVQEIDTSYLLEYLKKYENKSYSIGGLLRSREKTCIYTINASFRGDPYPGCLAAIDYLLCREGKTFEDRKYNLVLLFGKLKIDKTNKTIEVLDNKKSTIYDFFEDVKRSARHDLLRNDYNNLENYEIPRYFMQVRYGSTYSKVKHIRVFSYFSDAILFPDGSLWRDG